jgi:hypothetical protein
MSEESSGISIAGETIAAATARLADAGVRGQPPTRA